MRKPLTNVFYCWSIVSQWQLKYIIVDINFENNYKQKQL